MDRCGVTSIVILIHGDANQAVPLDQSIAYRARLAGRDVALDVIAEARHMHLVKPERPAWGSVLERLVDVGTPVADAAPAG